MGAQTLQGRVELGASGRVEIGRGLVAYDAEDAEKIKGRSSPDVMAILSITNPLILILGIALSRSRAGVSVAVVAMLATGTAALPNAIMSAISKDRPGE